MISSEFLTRYRDTKYLSAIPAAVHGLSENLFKEPEKYGRNTSVIVFDYNVCPTLILATILIKGSGRVDHGCGCAYLCPQSSLYMSAMKSY